MTYEKLLEILAEIEEILRGCDLTDRADWISQRMLVLVLDDDVAEEVRGQAIADLHSIVLGMGGLMDLRLVPTMTAPFTAEWARGRLDELADALYARTRGDATGEDGR